MAGQGGLAREIRAGLEVIEGKKIEAVKINKLDELFFRKPIRQHIKEFAALFAFIMLSISAYLIYKNSAVTTPLVLIAVSLLLIALGYKTPSLLYPVWNGWMKFAHGLSIIMTFVILSVAWSVALLPISLILRILRIKVMDVSFREPVETYWETRDKKYDDFKLLERQF